MNKTWILVFLFYLSQIADSYSQEWKYRFGAGVDFNLPNYAISNVKNGTSRAASRTWGLGLNGLVEASPNRHFAIQSGLSLKLLGAQLTYSEFGKTNVVQRTYWAQLPLNFVFKVPLRDSSNFYASAGPYGGFGLFGSNEFSDNYTGTKQDFSFGNSATQQRLDYGLNFQLGYKLSKGYQIGFGYQHGLQDIAPENARYEQRNRSWSASLAVSF